MERKLEGCKVACVVADGFEEVELVEPVKELQKQGAEVRIVSLKPGRVKGWNHTQWGGEYPVDEVIEQASPDEFDALLLPGGVMNPDHLRESQTAIDFIKHFVDTKKPIASICHGPWTLINAGAVRGRRMTSYNSIRVDLENAGAQWVDEPVVTDRGLVTSRQPSDIPQFNRKMVEEFSEGRHDESAMRSRGSQAAAPM